jgi:YD repeat-containing protein
MIGYKASYNGKCESLQYETGKTYTFDGELKVCRQGFHFCKDPRDTLIYYSIDNPEFQLFKVKALGEVVDNIEKSITNKIQILEIIPKSKYGELLGYFYDKNNNLIKRIDSYGNIFQYFYDDRNNKIKEIYPNGDIYQCEYDENNNKIKEIDSNGRTYQHEYDKNNNLIKEIEPNGDTYQYFYDENNNLIRYIDFDNTEWSITIE